MAINIKLNHAFQPYAGNHETIEVKGHTIKECLDNLIALFPVFRELLFNADDTLTALVLYEGETIVPNHLDRPVTEGSDIILLPLIQGG